MQYLEFWIGGISLQTSNKSLKAASMRNRKQLVGRKLRKFNPPPRQSRYNSELSDGTTRIFRWYCNRRVKGSEYLRWRWQKPRIKLGSDIREYQRFEMDLHWRAHRQGSRERISNNISSGSLLISGSDKWIESWSSGSGSSILPLRHEYRIESSEERSVLDSTAMASRKRQNFRSKYLGEKRKRNNGNGIYFQIYIRCVVSVGLLAKVA